MNPIHVLITAASRRVSLVRHFRTALQGTGGRVITVDFNTFSPALYFGDNHYTVPLVNDSTYFESLDQIIEREGIRLVIPTIDDELPLWADRREAYAARGVTVSISPRETIDVCNDKWRTFEFFHDQGLPFPRTYLPGHLTYQMDYPLFIKPRGGRGSVNSFIVRNKRELDFFVEYVPDPLVQDYVQGKEFTIDAFFSQTGELISYVPRYRLVIRAGVSDRGKTFRHEGLQELLLAIGQRLRFTGAVNLQGKIHRGGVTFFEINPRFSGGIQLSTAAGPNFASLLFKELNGESLTPDLGNYNSNLSMASYEDSIFIDSNGQIHFFYLDYQGILPESTFSRI